MKFTLGFLFCLFTLVSWAQETKPVYFESSGSEVRFYYDQNYFLVDKNCEFRTIERVGAFDANTAKLNGTFTDFDFTGRVILEGNYTNGSKEGLFKAYHPNGIMKWEVTYAENSPTGQWKYYYPDGKLMMTVDFSGDFAKIVNFYDQKGRARVLEGEGTYEFKVPFQGYNPYGYPYIGFKGKMKSGLPHGYWQIFYETDKIKDIVAEEIYKEGYLLQAVDLLTETEYAAPRFSLLPPEPFLRGELLVSKPCTYDDFIGFTMFLNDYFTAPFADFDTPMDVASGDFEYTVHVDRNGEASKPSIKKDVPKEMRKLFKAQVEGLQHYVPSFVDEKYIDDELTIRGKFDKNQTGAVVFHSIAVERKNES